MTAIRIIAAIVDQRELTMYREDGTTIIIPQGDPRMRPLVAKLVPALDLYGMYVLTQDDLQEVNSYAEAEKTLGGAVRFFKMLKSKAKEVLNKFVPVPSMQLGRLPEEGTEEEVVHPLDPAETDSPEPSVADIENAPLTRSQEAVMEIIKHSIPVTDEKFQQADTTEETTVVAVLADNTVIPGIEQISNQLQALASKMGSAEGVTNFFNRLASVERGHSVQDLLKFMEKGELPIADDGTVLVYKRLMTSDVPGVYVDCHTGKVEQRVGSHVFMSTELVDPNRHAECSNGLHVARRDYLNSFSGNICVLAKLAPEDVIAVPHRDARKLRAKGYKIIAVLSQEDHDNVVRNQPLKDTTLLGNAKAGNHTPVLETVEITGHRGTGVIITKVRGDDVPEVVLQPELKAESLDHLPKANTEAAKVDAAALAKSRVVEEPVAVEEAPQPPKEKKMSQAEQAAHLVAIYNRNPDIQNARALVSFKQKSKKSWDTLGVDAKLGKKLTDRVKL